MDTDSLQKNDINSFQKNDLMYKEIKTTIIKNSTSLNNIVNFKAFNLDLFPDFIGEKEIITIYRVFPDVQKLKVNLTFSHNGLLDNLRRFQKLRKLSFYLNTGDKNINRHTLSVKAITCKARFYKSDTDSIFAFITQFDSFKVFSIYGGNITIRIITLLELRKIVTLKIQNSIIRNGAYMIRTILNNNNLKYLSLRTDNYILSPYPVVVASDVISQLDNFKLNLERLTFTVDPDCRIRYENLRHLTSLKKMNVYFSVQGNNLNISKLINIAEKLTNVKTIFIEYVEKHKIRGEGDLNLSEELSYYYKNIIESRNNFLEVTPINYKTYRETEYEHLSN